MNDKIQMVANRWMSKDGTVLHSKHRHDYVSHIDAITGKEVFIDGGNDYIRMSGDLKDMCVFVNDLHEKIREVFIWRSYGKPGDVDYGVTRFLVLKDMETDHIEAILDTQGHIVDTYVEKIFLDELRFRDMEEPPKLNSRIVELVYRLRKRAEIRRTIPDRKSVHNNEPDRIAGILDEAADMILELANINDDRVRQYGIEQESKAKAIT